MTQPPWLNENIEVFRLRRHSQFCLLVCAFYLMSCSNDSGASESRIKVQLNRALREKAVSREFLNFLPENASSFDCYLINVLGDDIVSRPPEVSTLYPQGDVERFRAGSTCSYPGVSTLLQQPDANGTLNFQLQIPAGERRVIQLLGFVMPDGTCPPLRFGQLYQSILDNGEDPADALPGVYELGRIRTDTFPAGDAALQLQMDVEYSFTNPKHANCRATPLEIDPDIEPEIVTIGTGAFGLERSLSGFSGFQPLDLALGRFRDQGHLDLTVSYDNQFVKLFTGDDGEFSDAATSYVFSATGVAPSHHYLARVDIGDDGQDELLVNHTSSQSIAYYWSASNLPVTSTFINYGSSREISVAHVDGDVFEDLVGVEQNPVPKEFHIRTLDSSGSTFSGFPFIGLSSITVLHRALFKDLNADGFGDYLVSTDDSGFNWHLGNGSASFGSPTQISSGILPGGFFDLGDFNADGKIDIASIDNSATHLIRIASQTTPGNFASFNTVPVGGPASYFFAQDYNKDGWTDLFAIISSGSFKGIRTLENENGDFTLVHSVEVPNMASSSGISKAAMHDLNNDGFQDLILLNQSSGAADQTLIYLQGKTEIEVYE